MLTLRDLKEMREKSLIGVVIDFPDPDDEDGAFVSITTNWNGEIVLADVPAEVCGNISVEEGLIALSDGRTFKIEDVSLFVSIERGYKAKKRRQWEEIKQLLKKYGFTHREGQSNWFNVWEKGGWDLEPK